MKGWSRSLALTDARSLGFLASIHPTMVVHAWAAWNREDGWLDRSLESLQRDPGVRIQFYGIDIDQPENFDWAAQLGIIQVPSLVIYTEGELRGMVAGHRSLGELRRILDPLIRGPRPLR